MSSGLVSSQNILQAAGNPPFVTRVFTIIHLCLTFALLVWNAGYPFSGEIFAIKMRKSLYHNVMGVDSASKDHAKMFQNLPVEQQDKIKKEYEHLLRLGNRSFFSKVSDGLLFLAFAPSPFERAWIFFSLIISFLILFNYPGAQKAVWLLPVITLCFAFDNIRHGDQNDHKNLFPSEKHLVDHYIGKPLSPEINRQLEELRDGWERYLIVEWAGMRPSEDVVIRRHQKSLGEFAFNLKRVTSLQKIDRQYFKKQFNKKQQKTTLFCYLLWNVLFALSCLPMHKEKKEVLCNRC